MSRLARCVVAGLLLSALAGCALTDKLTNEPLPAPIMAPVSHGCIDAFV